MERLLQGLREGATLPTGSLFAVRCDLTLQKMVLYN